MSSCYSLSDFSYNGRIKIQEFYRDETNGATHNVDWTKDLFDFFQQLYEQGELRAPSGTENFKNIQ